MPGYKGLLYDWFATVGTASTRVQDLDFLNACRHTILIRGALRIWFVYSDECAFSLCAVLRVLFFKFSVNLPAWCVGLLAWARDLL